MSSKKLLNKPKVTKCCPFCELQVAVACKACPGCQHSFYNAKKMSLAQSAIIETNGRRTQRVKREKPNYYDASEFEKKTKRRLDRRQAPVEPPRERTVGRPSTSNLNKKKKKKKSAKVKDTEEEEPPPVLSNDKLRQCTIILAELNRKFMTTAVRL
uniref:Uncharacterized protein n=1 Tax=Lygus hesperus TaxID=30085 RepID=A0A0A9Z852_LYGHE